MHYLTLTRTSRGPKPLFTFTFAALCSVLCGSCAPSSDSSGQTLESIGNATRTDCTGSVTPDGSRLHVAGIGAGDYVAIDTASNAPTQRIQLDARPVGINFFSPDSV